MFEVFGFELDSFILSPVSQPSLFSLSLHKSINKGKIFKLRAAVNLKDINLKLAPGKPY